ncbi:MAG TPA: O-antigen ligase family protein [Gaiellaceae bacterium]|nr:O-antigen ligase family protein [Gaiellaceae bacterium]
MTARARIGLGGAALIGPLVAFPTLLRPQLAIGLCLVVAVTVLAYRSVAYPLGLWALPGVILGLAGNAVPSGTTEYFLVGWLGLSLLLALLRDEHVLPVRVLLTPPVLMTLALAVLMLARLGSSADQKYGSYKLQIFLAESVMFLVGGVVVGRVRRHVNLWLGLSLATLALGSLVILRKLLAGEATDVLPGRLALYAEAGPIALARGAATGLLLAIFVLLAARRAWPRTAALAVIPILAVAFIGAGSRGPVVGLAAGLLILLVLTLGDRVSRRRLLLLGAALLVSAVIIPQLVPGQNISRSLSVLVGQNGEDVGGGDLSNGRYQLWSKAWHAFGDHPLLGLGTGGFASVSPEGIYPHNIFLEAAAEYGILGLFLVAGVIGFGFFYAGRAWALSRDRDRDQAALVLAFLGAAVVNAQFSGDFTNNTAVWLGAGLALGLLQRVAASQEEYQPLRRFLRRSVVLANGPQAEIPVLVANERPAVHFAVAPRPRTPQAAIVLEDPGEYLAGTITLRAHVRDPGRTTGVAFHAAAAGTFEWRQVGSAARAPFETGVATEQLADGVYDLRAVAQDVGGGMDVSRIVHERCVDNTAPVVQLEEPTSGLTVGGIVRLRAVATDAGSGVAAVGFEWSRDGLDWAEVATTSVTPYACSWDTTRLVDGQYRLRAFAVDAARNRAVGADVAIEVWNGLFTADEVPLTSLEGATLWQLERLLERLELTPVRRDELEALLYTLRPYALTDGTIPQRFAPLLAESFGNLLSRT